MAHYVARHAAPRPKRTRKRRHTSGGLTTALGFTVAGILILGSALTIRQHPTEPLTVAGPDYPAADPRAAAPPPAGAAPAGAARAGVVPAPTAPEATCVASWYAGSGPLVATAANLPLGSSVRITNLANGLSTVVRVSGRGPAAGQRCLNLSQSAFAAIADLRTGLINVRYESVV
jgi:hypothetical protein